MTPAEYAAVALVATGAFFGFVAAVGLVRLPDVYTRTHSASKSDTLAAVLTLGGVAIVLETGTPTVKAVFLLLFMFLTNPTAAHAIARAAQDQGIDPWTRGDSTSGPSSAGESNGSGTDGTGDRSATGSTASDGSTAGDTSSSGTRPSSHVEGQPEGES